jgi:ABC-type glycerol-3-phosphate transport system substrate-binding protein
MAELDSDVREIQGLHYYQYEMAYILPALFKPGRHMNQQEAAIYPDIDEIAGIVVNSGGDATYMCYQAYSMNANSQNKGLTWAFLKFLLSDEMQQSANLLGFPVNHAAFDEKTKTVFTDGLAEDGRRDITKQENIDAYHAYRECLDGFVSSLRYYPVTDRIINNMVEKEALLVFNGSKSAEEAATTLQNKVQLYLNE